MSEDYMLRFAHPLYDEWCAEDDEDVYGDNEYDPYEEGEARWEMETGR